MKAYPTEFRQKIIHIYYKEKLSIKKLAVRFCVAKSLEQKLLKQYKETGDINQLRRGGNPKRKLNAEHLVALIKIISTHNDATLEELCNLLEKKVNVRVSRATMGRVVKKLNYTLKKNILSIRKRK